MTPSDLRAITRLQSPELVPEISHYGLPDGMSLDVFRTQHAKVLGAGVPYWAIGWPGGQALARCVLDHPEIAAGQHVVDIGCGAGFAAIAAARAGATSVLAVDHDLAALIAVHENARVNGVTVHCVQQAVDRFEPDRPALILAGDLWYEPLFARKATEALRRFRAAGHEVLFGDPGRSYRPRTMIEQIACYELSASHDLEAAEVVEACVYALGVHDYAANALPTCTAR